MSLPQGQQQEIVNSIKNSSTFKKSASAIALLQYLFEATERGIDLKESVIDIEFFGGNGEINKDNPRVRVNVYHLRKKIAKYYKEENEDAIWRLAIDKGQYRVSFYKEGEEEIIEEKSSRLKYFPHIIATIAILTLIITNWPKTKPEIWEPFFRKETNLFVGDHFGAAGKTVTGNSGWIRDFNINSAKELYKFLDQHPELRKRLRPANYTYTTKMGALATQDLQRFFQEYDSEFSLRFSSQLSVSELKERNAIYVGPTKNQTTFIDFFNEGNPNFKISKDVLKLHGHPEVKDTVINIHRGITKEEYAIVSKYPSTNNTEHLVFFSQHDIGVTATVEYFTQKDSLNSFSKKYLKDHEYFTALFKVKGKDRTDTDLKLEMVVPF